MPEITKNISTAFHWACRNGRTETVELMIVSSKDYNIDLNARDDKDILLCIGFALMVDQIIKRL